MDSNNNDTEVPADLSEEQASQLKMKDFAGRSKAKAKPQRREPVDYSSGTIPMNQRSFEESNPSSSSFSGSTMRRRRSSSILEKKELIIFGINFHKCSTGLTIVGNYAWQQEEEQKGDISTALIFQEQLFISELFKDIQDVISLILHYRTM